MISREEALRHIAEVTAISETEHVTLQSAAGRVLAAPVVAKLTHPPKAMSAMDGYAVRSGDTAVGTQLKVIGESAAGHPFEGAISAGECVRIFTGSVIPEGADHVVIQEDTSRTGDTIEITDEQSPPRHIRAAGVDFTQGDTLIEKGTRLIGRQLSICASANHAELSVIRRPRVALLANGDELKQPGQPLGPGEIIASNEYSLTALIEQWGGEVINLGIAPDDPQEIRARIENASDVDVFVPVGGASVGDHDHMKRVFADLNFTPVFAKVAVRPGKPTWMSQSPRQLVLGLPGNPASALVCAHLFVKPLLHHLLGYADPAAMRRAKLAKPLAANGRRETFLRGRMNISGTGEQTVTAAGNQDSSLLSPFVTSNVLIHRAIDAEALDAGAMVDCIPLD